MRLLCFRAADGTHLGLLRSVQVNDVTALAPALHDVGDWLAASESDRSDLVRRLADAPVLALDTLELAMPLARPGKVVCLGLNYRDHAAEGGHAAPEYPAFFLRATSSLLAPNQPLLRPACSDKLDFEAELAVVIGARRRPQARSARAARCARRTQALPFRHCLDREPVGTRIAHETGRRIASPLRQRLPVPQRRRHVTGLATYGFGANDLRAIGRGNAQRLLPRWVA